MLAAVGDVLASQVRAATSSGATAARSSSPCCPTPTATAALEVAEKLRIAVSPRSGSPALERPITASFGVAVHPDAAGDAETLLRLADRALYAAKNAGRNRVELAGSEHPAPLATR